MRKSLQKQNKEELSIVRTTRKRRIAPLVSVLQRKWEQNTLGKDAYCHEIRRVLQQKQIKTVDRPDQHSSRILSDREQIIYSSQLKQLAIVLPMLFLRCYWEAIKLTVRIDHHASKWFLNQAEASGKLAASRICLIENDFEIFRNTSFKYFIAHALLQHHAKGRMISTAVLISLL